MSKKLVVHTSDIREFKSCRRRWSFSSPWRGNWVPKRSPMFFTRGRSAHKALEQFYASGADPSETWRDHFTTAIRTERMRGADFTLEEIQEEIITGNEVLSLYPDYATKNDNFEVVAVEETGEVPLTDKIDFAYRADQVIRKNDRLWIHDFKTTQALPREPAFLDFDEQITGYLKACELVYGEPFQGALFTYILWKKPTEPVSLKGGGLSQNKKIYTTPKVYFDKLVALGENPKDYAAFIKQLAISCVWFVRFEIIKTRAEKETLWETHKCVAKEMAVSDVLIYPCPNMMSCNTCAYKSPCLIQNQGKNPHRILESEFIQGKER